MKEYQIRQKTGVIQAQHSLPEHREGIRSGCPRETCLLSIKNNCQLSFLTGSWSPMIKRYLYVLNISQILSKIYFIELYKFTFWGSIKIYQGCSNTIFPPLQPRLCCSLFFFCPPLGMFWTSHGNLIAAALQPNSTASYQPSVKILVLSTLKFPQMSCLISWHQAVRAGYQDCKMSIPIKNQRGKVLPSCPIHPNVTPREGCAP